jgi:hypothetical protein
LASGLRLVKGSAGRSELLPRALVTGRDQRLPREPEHDTQPVAASKHRQPLAVRDVVPTLQCRRRLSEIAVLRAVADGRVWVATAGTWTRVSVLPRAICETWYATGVCCDGRGPGASPVGVAASRATSTCGTADGFACAVGELWTYYSDYPYMPRLRDRRVLNAGIEAFSEGSTLYWQQESFALADDFEGGVYKNLVLPTDKRTIVVRNDTLILRPDVAEHQRGHEEPPVPGEDESSKGGAT